jgi:hypothetical protein
MDRVPCPHCGADLYPTESICWRCQMRVVPTAGGPVGPPPPRVSATARGGELDDDELRPPSPPNGPRRLAHWSLGLGIATVACACPLLGPVALWLGLRARREGERGVALAGAILGGIGTAALAAAVLLVVGWGWQSTLTWALRSVPGRPLGE